MRDIALAEGGARAMGVSSASGTKRVTKRASNAGSNVAAEEKIVFLNSEESWDTSHCEF